MTFAFDLPPAFNNSYNYLYINDPPKHIYGTGAEFTAGVTAMCRKLVNKEFHRDEL